MRNTLKSLIVILLTFCATIPVYGGGTIPVIPLPAGVRPDKGVFELNGKTTILHTAGLHSEADYLAGKLSEAGYEFPVKQGKGRIANSIILRISPETGERGAGKQESYTLEIAPRRVTVTGANRAGVFYGIVTLLQLIDARQGEEGLQCMTIVDSPRYAWRGFLLDESRHFFGEKKVRQILDMMALFKLNKLHWHLTDSHGWRIEILRYPRLATIGGRGSWSEPESDEVNFYTQEQIRRIIAYAAERHIEIIPEIDMPGHANAALRAYPQYSGGISKKYGEFTFNPGNEDTYAFLGGVLREVAALFPSEYIHIGGDEVAFGIESWNTDTLTQRLMRREGFTKLRQVEKYFIDRMSDTVRTLGKKIAGWDEMIGIDAPPQTTIFWWRHNKPEALQAGNPVVLCPRVPCYFDFINDKNHKWGRIWNGTFGTLQGLYAFPDDMFALMGLPAEHLADITGLQANMWTERVPYAQRLDYMMWPRLCALAESAWTPAANKDWAGFEQRMQRIYAMFDRLGIYYYDHRDPGHHPEPAGREKSKVKIQAPVNVMD